MGKNPHPVSAVEIGKCAEKDSVAWKRSSGDFKLGTFTHQSRPKILLADGWDSASGSSFLLSFLDSLTSTHFRQLNSKEAHG